MFDSGISRRNQYPANEFDYGDSNKSEYDISSEVPMSINYPTFSQPPPPSTFSQPPPPSRPSGNSNPFGQPPPPSSAPSGNSNPFGQSSYPVGQPSHPFGRSSQPKSATISFLNNARLNKNITENTLPNALKERHPQGSYIDHFAEGDNYEKPPGIDGLGQYALSSFVFKDSYDYYKKFWGEHKKTDGSGKIVPPGKYANIDYTAITYQ